MTKRERERTRKREEREQKLDAMLRRIEYLWGIDMPYGLSTRRITADDIAEILNREGMTTARGLPFTADNVRQITSRYDLIVPHIPHKISEPRRRYTEQERYNMQLDRLLKNSLCWGWGRYKKFKHDKLVFMGIVDYYDFMINEFLPDKGIDLNVSLNITMISTDAMDSPYENYKYE